MDELSGAVERVTFYNPENGYSVLRLRPDQRRLLGVGRDGLVTVVGSLPELSPGEHLRLQGRWAQHPKHGLQFEVERCEQKLPATITGIQRYLGSGLIRGIGPRLADRIVSTFGERTLEVIEQEPEQLLQVPDIGPLRQRLIVAAWREQKQIKEIMLFLHSHGLSTQLAVKIYRQYGDQAISVVSSDPYRLARDIFGIGFKTADKIAQALGLAGDHPGRLEAGVLYVLEQMTEEGHVFCPRPELEQRTQALLEVGSEPIQAAVDRLIQAGQLRLDELPAQAGRSEAAAPQPLAAVYQAGLFRCEVSVAERLRVLAEHWPTRLSDLPPAFVALDPMLSPEQQAAIRTALSHPVSILTGGPGTGKTTAMQALIAALEAAGKSFALASPTGRAAKRLSQATGRPASTLHRLLGYNPAEGFKHHAENPLPVDLVVVDEASMLDLPLAYHLLNALQPGTHLLLVGDVDQLPSVGAGDVLRDIIASGVVPVTRLNVIFRQAATSRIITNAHRINQGQVPLFPSSDQPAEDFYLFPADDPEEAAGWVEEVVCHRIPRKFGLHPLEDIQVIAPMYRGAAGVTALNARLQAALNPPAAGKPEKRLFGQLFRPGDKLMQMKNNYDKEVFNGDIGRLHSLDLIEHTLTVNFEGRLVQYDWSDADQLALAYAVSVHKAQGSEFPAVVILLTTQHYVMLQRSLLYTAVTRARRLCVLVGSRKAIQIAVQNQQVRQRYSGLAERLRGGREPKF